ncbi:hypothetical protein BHQ29_09155 [Pseudomonas sp. LPH1]|nr:hypothetical protein BHQ29_09155 [Pseudomonas sp. LPH1]
MSRHCLICESESVLSQEAAAGVALLISLADAAWRGARSTQQEYRSGALLNGLAAIRSSCSTAMKTADDVARYHFAGFDCLCLRCGALFDKQRG